MHFNEHSRLAGSHAFLSASKYHWINYDDEKIARVFRTAMAAQRGTELHAFAFEAIRLGIKLPRTRQTLNMYVNDALGYRMIPEQILFYSENAFGTADAISFRKNLLRIHDFKSGETKTSMRQLEVYAALFCLEYGFKPAELDMELRIYQNDDIILHDPDIDDLTHIMDKIVNFDVIINRLKGETL